jgi:hypothetical protein
MSAKLNSLSFIPSVKLLTKVTAGDAKLEWEKMSCFSLGQYSCTKALDGLLLAKLDHVTTNSFRLTAVWVNLILAI